MEKIFIGTSNADKIAEIASLLSPLQITLEPISLDIPETEITFDGNARLKALAYARHTGGLTIAEDSGISVPAIRGLPGPWSARFSDCEITPTFEVAAIHTSSRSRPDMDTRNNALLLQILSRTTERAATLHVALAVARPDAILFEASAQCVGHIATEARGSNGFGYDPLFIGDDTYGRTYAELDTPRKNARSHRAQVLQKLFAWISRQVDASAQVAQ